VVAVQQSGQASCCQPTHSVSMSSLVRSSLGNEFAGRTRKCAASGGVEILREGMIGKMVELVQVCFSMIYR